MNKQKLLNAKDYKDFRFSNESLQALDNLIDRALDNDIKYFYDALNEEIDNYFIYYADAWNYMAKYGDTDFTNAFNNGFVTICQIAYFNLEQEIDQLLNIIELSWDDFETEEE